MDKEKLKNLRVKNKKLAEELSGAKATLEAIQRGEVDALVVKGKDGEQVYTLKGADYSYRVFLEEMKEGAVILNFDGTILFANKYFAEITNKPLEKIIGSSIFSYIHPDTLKYFSKKLEKAKKEKAVGEINIINTVSPHPFSISLTPLGDAYDIPAISMIVTDLLILKEKERIEQKFKDVEYLSDFSRNLLKNMSSQEILDFICTTVNELTENCLIVVSEFDNKKHKVIIKSVRGKTGDIKIMENIINQKVLGLTLHFDPAVLRNMRQGKLEKIDKGIYQLSFHRIPRPVAKLLEKAAGIKETYFIPIAIDKEVLGSVAIFSKTKGRLSKANLVETTVNEAAIALKRSRVETVIKEAQREIKQLARIVETSNDAIYSRTINGTITSWNKGAEKLLGYKAKEMVGNKIDVIVPKSRREELQKLVEKVIKGENPEPLETVRKRKDKKLIDVSISISANRDSQGKITDLAIIARDVSEKKKFERRKDDFINIASHELKTPITSLKAYAQIIARKLQKSRDLTNLALVVRMESQINRLTSLVSDLLDVTKIESGKMLFSKEKFDLDELIQEVVSDIRTTAIISTDRAFEIEVNGHLNKLVTGDRFRIGQVLINLLTNAIKYSPDSDKIIISISSDSKETMVSVQDFGIGISDEEQKHLFERFFQASTVNDQQGRLSSLGLGLYIAAQIITRHGGRIWCKSKAGKGSVFFFSLPL